VKLARPEVTDGMVPEVPFVGDEANGFVDNGRWDEVVEGYQDGVLIVERKFKTYFSSTWANELLMDDQITSYIRNAILTYGVPLERVYVQFEVMWKPRTRPTKADAGSAEAKRKRYADLLVAKEEDHHTILLPGTEVLRRNGQQLQDWWDRFERMGADILRERELAAGGSVEAWPQHPHSCFRFNRHCEMIKLCTAANQDEFRSAMSAGFTTPSQREAKRRLLDELADVED
jgi:hypothetical protein